MYDTKHEPHYTITWPHEKERLEIKGHNKLYVWTHATYTKILGWETRNNFTFDVYFNNEITIYVAQTRQMTSLQVLYLSTHFIKDYSIIGYYLITNNIFLDKSYD
jgi:hypothetical protein